MTSARKAVAATFVGIATLSIAWIARAEGPKAQPAPADGPPRVQLVQVRTSMVTAKSEVTGTLQPAKALQLGFEVGGRLAQILVKKGAKVESGQTIAKLDPEIADAQVAQAEAALKVAEAGAAVADDAARRQGELRQTDNTSEQQATTAANQALAADAQVLAAKAQLAQARAARKRHELHAPFSGVLVDAPDQIGANVMPGAPLFTLEQLDPLSLRATAAEAERTRLAPGTRVHVESAASDAATDDATISAVIPSADAQTRRLPVEISVPNHQGRFTAHTLARALIPLGAQDVALVVKASALASTGGDHLFVIGEGNVVRRVPITVLERGSRDIVFRAPGETLAQVIDFPSVDLDTGMKVQIR